MRPTVASETVTACAGRAVPRYLLPPSDPLHVPPHVVAFEMLRKNDPNALGYPVDQAGGSKDLSRHVSLQGSV